MLGRIAALLREDAFESALAACGFLNNGKSGSRESLVLAGEALMGLQQYHRAVLHFRAAFNFASAAKRRAAAAAAAAHGGGAAKEAAAAPATFVDTSTTTIRYKVARCLEKLGQVEAALAELLIVDPPKRTLRVLLLLGRLQQRMGSTTHATATFKAAFNKDPMALEAVHALRELGHALPLTVGGTGTGAAASKRTHGGADKLGGGSGGGAGAAGDVAATVPWLGPYLSVFNGAAKRDFALVNAAYDQLLADYPGNVQLLVQAGEARYDMGDRGGAKACFDRAFSLDEGLVQGMDAYARLLADATVVELTQDEAKSGGRYEPARRLNALAQNALPLARTHPEVLNIMALVHLTQGLKAVAATEDPRERAEAAANDASLAKANALLERSLSLHGPRVRTLELQAYAFERQGAGLQALRSIKKAVNLAGVNAAPGLLQSFVVISCANNEHRAAQRRAAKLVKAFPGTSTAHVVMARVHLEQRNVQEADAALAKALQLRPSDADAIVLHAQVLSQQDAHKTAVHELAAFVGKYGPSAAILLELGRCQLALGRYDLAQTALLQATELTESNPAHPLTDAIAECISTAEAGFTQAVATQ